MNSRWFQPWHNVDLANREGRTCFCPGLAGGQEGLAGGHHSSLIRVQGALVKYYTGPDEQAAVRANNEAHWDLGHRNKKQFN